MTMTLLRVARERACRTVRPLLVTGLLTVTFLPVAHSAEAVPAMDHSITLDISANTRLEDALIVWGSKAGMTVMINTPTVDQRLAPQLKGTLNARKALAILLNNSGLSYTEDGNRVRIIRDTSFLHSSLHDSSTSDLTATLPSESAGPTTDDGGDNRSRYGSGQNELEQVIVTAQKKTERLQDVPVPVTAISAQTLSENSQPLLRDFSSSVPGLSISPSPGTLGEQNLAIRGLSTGYNLNPTVAISIDDVPFISQANNVLIDLDPGSLERIEVLRGPQGTLYGVSGMGGLIKYLTSDPSTSGFFGRVQAGVNGVENGAEPGYDFSASANIPVSDTFAVRLSGSARQDAGYIDNIVSHVNGVNEAHSYGGVLTALFKPSDVLSVKVNALFQDLKGDGAYEATQSVNGYPGPPVGDLQQWYLPGVGGYERKIQLYSATLNLKLAGIDVTSISAYQTVRFIGTNDVTSVLSDSVLPLYGVSGAVAVNNQTTNKVSQELRALIPITDKFEWLIGGFFTRETVEASQGALALDSQTGAFVSTFFNVYSVFDSVYKEAAGFTDLTYHITDKFDIQVGGRESQITQVAPGTAFYYQPDGSTSVGAELSSKLNAFSYLVTPRLKLSEDFMLYGRFASGYQPGGANTIPASTDPQFDPKEPAQFSPSYAKTYELGVKGDVLAHTLSYDASLYYINWTGLQINVVDPINTFNYTANASTAKSAGIELAVTSKPIPGLTLSGWIDYDDAVLTKAFPSTATLYGMSGDRLPYGARFSANLSGEDMFHLPNNFAAFVGATVGYVGDRVGNFEPTSERTIYPSYTKADLRTGLVRDSWRVVLYVNNVGDSRGQLGGGLGTYPPYDFTYLTPRTFGVNVSKTF